MQKLYEVINNWSDSTGIVQDLLAASIEAAHHAYAPYSNFRVGSSVLTSNQKIILGSNHENASYPLCMCAERVALYSSFSQNAKDLVIGIAVHALDNQKKVAAPPCGACRQVIREFEIKQDTDIHVYLVIDQKTAWKFNSIKDLLPHSFDPSYLK